jgi:hypothetical protein
MSDKVVVVATEWVGEFVRNVVVPYTLPIVERNLIPDAIIRMGIRREIYMVGNKHTQNHFLV